MNEIMIHIEDDSFGIYPFPFNVVEVDSKSKSQKEAIIRSGELIGNECILKPEITTISPFARTNLKIDKPVTSWLECSPQASFWHILSRAMPNFWFNRFKFGNNLGFLKEKGEQKLEVSKMFNYRISYREKLHNHSEYLDSKIWSLGYHRKNFFTAIDNNENDDKTFDSLKATAEFAAHDECIYSILEEFTSIYSIFQKIITSKDVSKSFHQLYDSRNKKGFNEELKQILNNASWYESFRLRRANNSHYFGSIIRLDDTKTDFYLFQHPEQNEYKEHKDFIDKQVAKKVFQDTTNNIDKLISEFSVYLLSLFHFWDIVTINQKEPSEEKFEEFTVWVRNIVFDEKYNHSESATVLINKETNNIVVKNSGEGLIQN